MNETLSRTAFRTVTAAALMLSLAPQVHADGRHAGGHGHGHSAGIGEPGDPSAATRTIEVVMTENRFAPDRITVRKGETVRFVVRNAGEAIHEFNIGTARMHRAHRKEMEMMVERGVLEVDRINHVAMRSGMKNGNVMMHDDPNSKLLEPGRSTELVWKFDTDADLEFACNVPGHYEAGMKGEIHVR